MRFIRIFSELSNQIRYASQKRVLIELALIQADQAADGTQSGFYFAAPGRTGGPDG